MTDTFRCIHCFSAIAKEGEECEISPTGLHGKYHLPGQHDQDTHGGDGHSHPVGPTGMGDTRRTPSVKPQTDFDHFFNSVNQTNWKSKIQVVRGHIDKLKNDLIRAPKKEKKGLQAMHNHWMDVRDRIMRVFGPQV